MPQSNFDAGRAIIVVVLSVAALASIGMRAFGQPQASDPTAMFGRIATVLQHPRCLNCHTNTQFPKQGNDRHRHTLNVLRGPHDDGAAGLHCHTCHQAHNQTASGVPGVAGWRLAPLRMAWEGLSARELCKALFDPARGGMKPDQLVAHFETGLVRWAWSPGIDSHGRLRSSPPMTHAEFIVLTKQWLESGGSCPN